jgi:hypothetical protein
VGTRLGVAEAYQAFVGLVDVVPRPDHKASGEERAWGRRLAKRFGAEGRIDDRTFVLKGDGGTAGALDLGGPKVKEPDPGVAVLFKGLAIKRGDQAGDLRLGHGRGPGLGHAGLGQGALSAFRPPGDYSGRGRMAVTVL